jgi:two-component sensor histidine kinase/ligand-binding sensor protein
VPAIKELLDPESWGNVLEVYARTVNMGVALVDREGRLVGKCHNPQPIWSLAWAARTDWGAGCVFCLNEDVSCTAVADAQRTGALTVATDSAGFVHVAIPLVLGDQYLGTLLAGQVFDRYPELLMLERVARQFALSPQKLWDLARRSIPISRASLITYGNLLGTLSHAFVRERLSIALKRDLASANQELQSTNEHLKNANSELSGKVTELAQASAEKDVLLNEIHHRVNNNLQVISSLLRMQADAFPDDQVATALRGSQFRVESMALIHAQLYNSEDWRSVDFAAYINALGENLFRSYGIDQARIALHVDIAHFALSVNKAIPAALILNELISNALKHAFPGDRSGSILIHGGVRGGRIELSVQDDGAGAWQTIRSRSRQSLGLNIVDILCHQLKGTFVQPQGAEDSAQGSIFRLSFPYETALGDAGTRGH